MAKLLKSHLCGSWQAGSGKRATLHDPTTGEIVAETSTEGLDFEAAIRFARETGGPALRALTFAQRGELLQQMANALHEHRDELLDLSRQNGGNTRGDAKFDVDGATGTLGAYAKLGAQLGDTRLLVEGDPIRLGRSPRFVGRHVQTSLHGVAVHINAFNFPAWGLAEKAAVALLAGMPVITKPATSTALLAVRMVEILVEREVLPPGALSIVSGSAGDLLQHVGSQDVIGFTGSADTGARIRSLANVIEQSVRVNIEADSLNSVVLGPDVESGGETWELFVREVGREITQKAGQKCTAVRRIALPAHKVEEVREALAEELRGIRVGNPGRREVRMGPLATAGQLDDIRAGIERLQTEAEIVHGAVGPGELVDAGDRGYFQQPVLLLARDPHRATEIHCREVFGPVATLMPYDGSAEDAAVLMARGGGSLVGSVYTDDAAFATALTLAVAPYHGRVNIGSAKVAGHSIGPGAVLPQLVHGGPGRAGGGEELGGLRGLSFYMQRTALQGDEPLLAKIVADAYSLPSA